MPNRVRARMASRLVRIGSLLGFVCLVGGHRSVVRGADEVAALRILDVTAGLEVGHQRREPRGQRGGDELRGVLAGPEGPDWLALGSRIEDKVTITTIAGEGNPAAHPA